MGYSSNTKGYVILDIKTKKFHISRNVIFREKIFPFKDDFSKIINLNHKILDYMKIYIIGSYINIMIPKLTIKA